MPSVVIIHAADDALPARALGEKLRLAKLTPVIEKAAGDERQSAVKNAAVTIALWSPRSIQDQGVASDVAFARGKGKLVHACMQSVQPPGDFHSEQWVDLTGWRGEDDFAAWRQLADVVTEKAGVGPLPPPAPRPPSGFFQPGRVGAEAQAPRPPAAPSAPRAAAPPPRSAPPRSAPPPRAPERAAPAYAPDEPAKGGPNMAVIGIVTFLVVALAGGGGYYFWTQSQGANASAAAWEQIDQQDPDALRAFLEGSPGAFEDEARDAYEELERGRYAAARQTDTVAALEAFIADFPDGENNLAARGRIAELRAQPATPEEVVPGDPLSPDALNPGQTVDPDLVPPGSTTGPVPLEPEPTPEPEPEPTPEPAPTP